jgi:hypothetical protein
MNYELAELFNKGLIKEAIIGKGEFFSPNITWRSHHDYSYILSQLKEWAERNNKLDKLEFYLKDTFMELVKNDDARGIVMVLFFLQSVSEKKVYEIYKTFNFEEISDLIAPCLNKNSQHLVSDEEARSGIVAICKELPYLANKLGMA